jgi:hypothetical protein
MRLPPLLSHFLHSHSKPQAIESSQFADLFKARRQKKEMAGSRKSVDNYECIPRPALHPQRRMKSARRPEWRFAAAGLPAD